MPVELGAYGIVMIDVVFDRAVPIWGVNERSPVCWGPDAEPSKARKQKSSIISGHLTGCSFIFPRPEVLNSKIQTNSNYVSKGFY